MLASRQLGGYYSFVYKTALVTGILVGLTLIFSNARKRPWIKTAGIFTVFIYLIIFLTLIIVIRTQDFQIRNSLFEIQKWTYHASPLIFLFFIINFIGELRELKNEKLFEFRLRTSQIIMIMVGILAMVSIVYIGNKAAKEAHATLRKEQFWKKRKYEKGKILAGLFEDRNYISENGNVLPYRLLKPLNFEPEKKYPLVVILHDAGVHGKDNIIQLSCEPAPTFSKEVNRKKYPSFLFVPHCPKGASWRRFQNYPSMDSLVFETIIALEKEFEIDIERRYVVGGSGGGGGSWHFICSRPDMFAAAIPVCGAGNPDLAQKIVDVQVWAFHGAKDKVVPVERSRSMIEAIKKAGGNPKYTEFPDGVHNVWPQVLRTPGVWDWLFDQKRD
jgi:hypothetical protein